MAHVERQYSKNLPCTECNADVDHPQKAVGKRITTNLTPNQMSHVLDTRDGQPGDPVNNGLRARCFCQSELFAKNSKNSRHCSEPDTSYKEKLESDKNNIHLAANDWNFSLAFSLLQLLLSFLNLFFQAISLFFNTSKLFPKITLVVCTSACFSLPLLSALP